MASIHLNMVKLERYGQRGLEQTLAIFAPHHHRIAELVGVLVNNAVEFCLDHGRRADNHVVVKVETLAFISCLLCEHQVIAIELL